MFQYLFSRAAPLTLLINLFFPPHCAAAPTVDSIDGRQVETLVLRRPASPVTVVFESGLRGTLDKWGAVPQEVAKQANVFAYHRPGYGASTPATAARDGRTVVAELRRLLRQQGMPPPYVLVGHSLGGLYMQLFARAHRDEVAGLVLVDSLYPRMVKPASDFPWLTRLAARLAFSATVWREIEAIDDTGEQLLALAAIDDKPIVRLINRPTSATAIALDFGAFRTDPRTQDLVRNLYPKASTVFVDASHQIALDDPAAVVAAISQVIAASHPAPAR